MRDIIFEEFYAKNMNKQVQQIANNAFAQGKNQGLNEMMQIVLQMVEEKQLINAETIIAAVNNFYNPTQEK